MTLIEINVRSDSRTVAEDGAVTWTAAYAETLDLDRLTPRARALAEAITDGGRRHHEIAIETLQPAPPVRPEVLAAYGEYATGAYSDGTRRGQLTLSWMRADDPRTAGSWLEGHARALPHDWYPVAAVPYPASGEHPRRVPSADAAAADRYLNGDRVRERLARAGQPIGIQGWDTLRGTGYFPDPDFYTVDHTPLWLPEAVDAHLARGCEMWPVSRIAEYLGFAGPAAAGSARRQLSRWGLLAHSRQPGRTGESLYASDQVQAAHTHRPGRGARTDLVHRGTDDGL